MEEQLYNYRPARKAYSTVGFALTAVIVLATVGQILWFGLPNRDSWLVNSSWGYWLGSFLPLYVLAMPIGYLILKRLPAQAPEQHTLPKKAWWVLVPVCMFFTYSGNLVGTFLSALLSGGTAENAVVQYAMDSNPIKILFMVILAPLLEELLCRKLIIDRTLCYGEKAAVVFSGFVFGVLHQNFFQFFYAFTVGMLLAYIYIRTGRVLYSILLHAGLNFVGGILPSFLQSLIDPNAYEALQNAQTQLEQLEALSKILPGMLITSLYSLVIVVVCGAGFILLLVSWKKLLWKETDCSLPGKTVQTAYLNAGMILYILLCAGSFVLALM